MGVMTPSLCMLNRKKKKKIRVATMPAIPNGSAGISLGPKVCNMFSK
jgi:hypothetical protein